MATMVSSSFIARCSLLSLILLLFSLSSPSLAKSSPRPITDNEVRQKKNACYADIERSSVTEKENCALRCLSPTCFSLIYESDPLEEGEKDYIRSQEYKYCMHNPGPTVWTLHAQIPLALELNPAYRLSLGESLDGVKGSFDY